MFDFKFDWKPDMACGVEDMDSQHRQLFSIGRDIEQLIQINCIGVTDRQLLDIVCRLRDFCSYHFYNEESLMEKISYAKIKEHKAEHIRITNLLMTIDMPSLKREPVKVLKEVRDTVQHEIFEHMLVADMEFAKEYQQEIGKNAGKKTTAKKEKKNHDEALGIKLWDLDASIVYLCKEQSNRGRMIIIDREKTKGLQKMPSLMRASFFEDVSRAMKALHSAFSPDAMECVYVGDDRLAMHMHIIPKYKDASDWGKVELKKQEEYYPDEEELLQIAEQLKRKFK